ncbi:MAG: TlpA family protein disulfide reductase [Chloroflexi bacterium]|nr:MAG: TlpA family protein disulfide reductase [Chloroflexota bacterium]
MNHDSKPDPQKSSLPVSSRWFWAALIGVVLVIGVGWIVASQALLSGSADGTSGALDAAPVAGHPAPDFELSTPNGESIRLSQFKGKPVVVNFWATWCGPCRAEFPEFQQAAVDNADTLVILGVNSTSADQAANVPPFLEEFGVTFPVVLDEDGDVVDAYNVLGLPTTVFIDSDGVINEVFTGPLNKAYIESKISELQAGL